MTKFTDKIIQLNFSTKNYYKATYDKNQVVLHHTVSNGSAQAVARYWDSLANRIATCIILDKEGVMHQLFSSRFYAGHVGDCSTEMRMLNLPNRSCSKTSIGVELINLGGLKEVNGDFIDYYQREYEGAVTFYKRPYRGYNYFASYTREQIDSLGELLTYWMDRYDIPYKYNDSIWNVSKDALTGVKGIYSHTSFRNDKSDLHPQPNLISMLKTL